MAKDCDRSMAPPSSSVSDDAATGLPDRTRQAPSQPMPRALQPLSVKTDPSSVGIRLRAPSFIRPRAVTNRPRPTTPKTTRCHARPAAEVDLGDRGRGGTGPGRRP